MDPVLETLKQAVAAMRADATVNGYVAGRIFDRVPDKPEPASPYISLGPHDAVTSDQFLGDCVDGMELTFQLDVWSWGAGEAYSRDEASKIAAAIRKALHGKELPVGDNEVEIVHLQTRIMRDPDGITTHGVLSFEALVDL